jgi:hypothetical protein
MRASFSLSDHEHGESRAGEKERARISGAARAEDEDVHRLGKGGEGSQETRWGIVVHERSKTARNRLGRPTAIVGVTDPTPARRIPRLRRDLAALPTQAVLRTRMRTSTSSVFMCAGGFGKRVTATSSGGMSMSSPVSTS